VQDVTEVVGTLNFEERVKSITHSKMDKPSTAELASSKHTQPMLGALFLTGELRV